MAKMSKSAVIKQINAASAKLWSVLDTETNSHLSSSDNTKLFNMRVEMLKIIKRTR